MSRFNDLDVDEEGEFVVVQDKRKMKSQERRDRKEFERANSAAAVGAHQPEFDAETRRRMQNASFYGAPQQKGKNKVASNKRVGSVEEEEEWTPNHGGPNAKSKSKSKKPKVVVPQYNTADEIADALVEIISRVPPTIRGASTTIASLGDKLQTLTKQAWNKRYKPEFGSMKAFLESRAHQFLVEGDEVSLAMGDNTKKATKPTSTASKPTKPAMTATANSKAAPKKVEAEEESDAESDEDATAARKAALRKTQKPKQQTSEGSSAVSTIFASLVLVAAGVAYFYSDRIVAALKR